MYPFVESIKYFNGEHYNLEHHQQRFEFTRKAHYPACPGINLEDVLVKPHGLDTSLVYKCRVLYGHEISGIVYEPYIPRKISRYYLVVCPMELDYSFKFADRAFFDNARKRLGPDEDFIYIRNGCVTDTSYANVVFTDGNLCFTPAEPLLKGTKRAKYLLEKKIQEEEIKVRDLERFKGFFIINAMLDMGETPIFSCDNLLLSQIQPRL